MTTLENRPNTALLVIDVQNGVVTGAHRARRGRRQHRQPGRKGAAGAGSRRLGPALRRGARQGERGVEDRPRADSGRGRAAHREELRGLLRGHEPRDRALGPRSRAPRRRRRPDRCLHPLDASRGVRSRLRRHAGERRPHHRGPVAVGRAAAGPGHRPHQPVLDLPGGSGTHGRNSGDEGCRLQRADLTHAGRGTIRPPSRSPCRCCPR